MVWPSYGAPRKSSDGQYDFFAFFTARYQPHFVPKFVWFVHFALRYAPGKRLVAEGNFFIINIRFLCRKVTKSGAFIQLFLCLFLLLTMN
jgi:hypothetical protein